MEALSNYELSNQSLGMIGRYAEVIGLGNVKSNWDGTIVRSPTVAEVYSGVAYRGNEGRRHPRQE